MNTFFDNIVYKGVPFDIVQPNDCPEGLENPTLRLHTYGDDSVVVNYTLSGDMVTIHIGTTDLDVLDDGVIYYEWANSESAITCNNTVYTLKTPEGYDPISIEDIYESGYTSGHTAGMEDQKDLMVEADIVENGTYTRPDGYSTVNVNVGTSGSVIFEPQGIFDYRNTFYASGTPWSALTVDAQHFGDEQYTGGYNYALNNIDVESVQLSVSANGEYDAVIGPGGDGYIKKVIVDVPQTKGMFLIDKEYELPIAATLKSDDDKVDKRKVKFGVAFGNLSDTEYKFATVAGVDFWVNSISIWAEYEDSHDVEYDETIHSRITTGVTYGITLEVGGHSLEINGEPFGPDNDDYDETYVSGTYFGNSALTMNLSYFEYFTSSGVSQINVTNYAESGLTFAIVKRNPVLQNKEVTIWADGDTVITPDGAGGELVDGYYAMSSVTVHTQVHKWSQYYDYIYYLVREDCSNDGTYLCHCNGGNTYAGVEIQNGHIINTGFMPNPTQLGEDHYICIKDYSNPDTGLTEHYSFECWIEYGKLHWKCSARVWLDAYDTGTNKQGLYLNTL